MAVTVNPDEYRVPFSELKEIMDWRQDEHVTLIGPTGSGKTTLTNAIIMQRSNVIFLGTKRKDSTQDELMRMGFKVVQDPDLIHPDLGRYWIVRPPFPQDASAKEIFPLHREVFRRTLMKAFNDTGYCVVVDEARYVYGAKHLGLDAEGVLLYTQGRSQDNAIVTSTQRPRWVPLEAYDQAYHMFFFKDRDMKNIKRVAEMAGTNPAKVVALVRKLKRHEFLYVNPFEGIMAISQVDER